jgi:hypothetical protein
VATHLVAGLIFGRMTYLAVYMYAIMQISDALLDTLFRAHHPHMEGVLRGRFSAQLPDDEGMFGGSPASRSVVILMVGARCNQLRRPFHTAHHHMPLRPRRFCGRLVSWAGRCFADLS